MNAPVVGLAAGMALGFAGYFGGLPAFLLVAVLGAAGFVVGRLSEGGVDLRHLLRPESWRR